MFKKLKNIICLSMAVFAPLSLMAAAKDTTTNEDGSFDNNGFYVGVNAGAGYIPSDDFKFSSDWDITASTPSQSSPDAVAPFNGNIIKSKGVYDFIGSSFIGYMMSNFQFEIEGGMTISPKLKAKSTTIQPVDENDGTTKTTESIADNEMGKEKIFFGLINGYFNIDTGNTITPYIGFGAGIAHYKIIFSDNAFNKNFFVSIHEKGDPTAIMGGVGLKYIMENDMTKNTLILHGTAGASMKINDKVIIGLGYRFIGSAGEIELETPSKDSGVAISTSATNQGDSYRVSGKLKHQFMKHIGTINAKMLF